jgi:hypothetical protein
VRGGHAPVRSPASTSAQSSGGVLSDNYIAPACCLTSRCYHVASPDSYPFPTQHTRDQFVVTSAVVMFAVNTSFIAAARLQIFTRRWSVRCGIHSMAITETGPSRSPKPAHRDHRNRFIAIGGPANLAVIT